jgi:hypothetical protein
VDLNHNHSARKWQSEKETKELSYHHQQYPTTSSPRNLPPRQGHGSDTEEHDDWRRNRAEMSGAALVVAEDDRRVWINEIVGLGRINVAASRHGTINQGTRCHRRFTAKGWVPATMNTLISIIIIFAN